MTVNVTTTGNGRFSLTGDQSDVIVSYSMSESASPINVADLSGEIPSMSIVGLSNSVQTLGNTHPSSRLLIDNQITLTDSLRGSFTGKVGNLTIDPQSVSVDVFSKFDKLNVNKKMSAHVGTLKSAFEAWFAEAGLVSGDYNVDASLTDSVAFPSWRDSIWNGLKQLCVASSTEMYFQGATIYVKPRATKTANIENITSESFSINLGESAKTTKFTLGKSKATTNGIVFAYGTEDSAESINVLETKNVILTSKVSLTSINQPENISAGFPEYKDFIDPSNIGEVPLGDYPNGFYAFRDSDGIIVDTDRVTKLGASVTVALGDEPFEIKLKIVGPNTSEKAPWTLEFSDNSPALGLTGTGVVVENLEVTTNTGSSEGDSENEYSGNPFLINYKYFWNTVHYTNQSVCGPVVSFNFSTDKIVEAAGQEFGFTPGVIFSYNGSKYRIKTASYDYGSLQITAEQYVTFADFNSIWTGKSFAQFNGTMLDPTTYPNDYMKYSDFAILPLMEPTA